MRRIPYDEANAILRRDIKGLCRGLLPRGRATGQWWVASVPWREDKTPSLGVSLTTGHWEDFATKERGSPIDLLARLTRRTPEQVALELVPPGNSP